MYSFESYNRGQDLFKEIGDNIEKAREECSYEKGTEAHLVYWMGWIEEKYKNDLMCDDPNCSCSTGIHDGSTYGSGELDKNGYWEKPCRICAEGTDLENKKILEESEIPKKAETSLDDNWDWLTIPAWPYK